MLQKVVNNGGTWWDGIMGWGAVHDLIMTEDDPRNTLKGILGQWKPFSLTFSVCWWLVNNEPLKASTVHQYNAKIDYWCFNGSGA